MRQHASTSPAETREIGRRLSRCLVRGDVVLLQGDLAAGKTEFVKGLAEGFQAMDPVSSPTFTLLNVYQGMLPIYHFDLYRLENAEELYNIGFDDFLGGDGVTVIEWAERFPAEMPSEYLMVEILPGKASEERLIRIASHGTRYSGRLEGRDLF